MRTTELPPSERSMANVLREQATHVGADTFVLFGDQQFTYADADRIVDDYARGLQHVGVGPGTHVATMMENGPELLWLALAVERVSAVLVPVNTAYKANFLLHVLEQANAHVLVADAAFLDRLAPIEPQLDDLRLVVSLGHDIPAELRTPTLSVSELPMPGDRPAVQDVDVYDMATILYTSGTTGPSKGAMLSHKYWYDATVSSNDRRDIRGGDVFYVSSPMFHAASWVVCIYSALTTGLPVGLDRRFSVSEFWNRVRHFGATQIFTMSAMHMWLLNAPPRDDDRDNPARVWGPVPLAPELEAPFKERFGIEHLWFTYGQTEALMLTCTDTRKPYKPGSAGWARPEVEIAVVDDGDNVLPAGSVGELVVRTKTPSTIMDGYYDNPEATVKAFRNLWYHTGDIARIDEDGEVFYVDRKNDYLRVRGENVSSFEVESTIMEHPEVAEVAVYAISAGTSSEDEVMIAVVRVAGSDLGADELCRYCNERLPYFAVPRYIDFVDDFPRTPTNRVQKYQLRERGVSDTTWDRIAAGFEVTR